MRADGQTCHQDDIRGQPVAAHRRAVQQGNLIGRSEVGHRDDSRGERGNDRGGARWAPRERCGLPGTCRGDRPGESDKDLPDHQEVPRPLHGLQASVSAGLTDCAKYPFEERPPHRPVAAWRARGGPAGARNDVGSATITLRPAPPVRQPSPAPRRRPKVRSALHFSRNSKTPQPLNVVLNWRGRPNPTGEACVACLGARVRAIERVTGSKANGRPTLERVPMAVEATGARRHPAAVAGERKR